MLYNLTVLVRWHEFGRAPAKLKPIKGGWSQVQLKSRLETFFLHGQTNVHQITLAEALIWVWWNYPDYRDLAASNIVCFSEMTRV